MTSKRGHKLLRHPWKSVRRAKHRHVESLERRTLLNAAPVAGNDVFTIPVDYALTREAPALLANDTDADSNPLHVASATAPLHGDLTWNTDGSFAYTPDAGFLGVDTFTYFANDGTVNSNAATVKIRVGDYSQGVLDAEPLAYWRLDDANPGSRMWDSSPNALHGLYNYVPEGEGGLAAEPGKSGKFGEHGSSVHLYSHAALRALRNNFTVEAWVNPNTLTGDGEVFTNTEHEYTTGFSIRRIGNRLNFAAHGIKDYLSPVVFPTANTWYHIAVSIDAGNDVHFYVNGQLAGSVAGVTTPGPSNSIVMLGNRSNSTPWKGELDEVATYNRLLTADEIAQHHALGSVASGMRPATYFDSYEANAGETLNVSLASTDSPRHSLTESFDGDKLPLELEDVNGGFEMVDGVMQQTKSRRYMRTIRSDYTEGDFVYELDVDLTSTAPGIMFVGIGDGVVDGQAYDEPVKSIFFRMHTVYFNGMIDIAVQASGGSISMGTIDTPGVHRTRFTKVANQLTVEIDAHYNGVFEADLSHTFFDFAAISTFLNPSNSNLFFGGDVPGNFDNLYIESSLAPGVVTGVMGNDFGIRPETQAVLLQDVAHGELTFLADGTFAYTPDPGFNGEDSFTYQVDDGKNVSAPATARLLVNGAPVAAADAYTVQEDGVLDVRGAYVQLADTGFNDNLGIGANPTANSPYRLSSSAHGQGAAEPGWRQGWQSEPATSTIVTNPVYEGDGALRVVPTSNTYRRWSEPQRGVVTVDQYLRFTPNSKTSIVFFDGQIGCRCETSGGPYFRMDSDGKIKVLDGTVIETTGLTWNPNVWYRVTVRADVEARTWRLWIDDQEVATPDPLGFFGTPTKLDAILYLTEGTSAGAYVDALTITSGTGEVGLLENDSDPNGDEFVAELVTNVAHGSLDLRKDGTFIYRPAADFSGVDQFTYRLWDGRKYSDPTTVTLNVMPVNDLPKALNDAYVLQGNGTLAVNAAGGVLANDSDVDSTVLTVALIAQAEFGAVTLNADGSFHYAADPGFAQVDSFTYQVSDGNGVSTIATVTLTRELPSIEVGSHVLAANQPGQQIPIYVTGGLPISGLNLFVQIGDGGPERVLLDLPAGVDGPAISSVDLKQNTIFAGVPDVPSLDYAIPQVVSASISIAAIGGTVPADGLLATITFDTSGLMAGTWDFKLFGVLPELQGGPFNSDFAGMPIEITNGQLEIIPATIAARQVFYAGSEFDDEPVSDKQALLPGETATFANYTSYVGGINAVAVDIANSLGTPTLADFRFFVGNSNDTSLWQPAPTPSLEVLAGAGVAGADRVLLRWADGAIAGKWLMVRVKSSIQTGLAAEDVFYFGNAIGESGDSAVNALVNATDIIGTRDNPHGPLNPAAIDDRFDFNRDRLVNATDLVIARDHSTSPLSALRLITPTGALPPAPPLRGKGPQSRTEIAPAKFTDASSGLATSKDRYALAAIDAVFQAQEVMNPWTPQRKTRTRQV